jgi:predicted ATP-grasp superfamily ATP-dependent carboligase
MPADGNGVQRPFEGLSEVLAPRDRAESRWPPAVVASVFQTGLNLMRDLEQKGVRVIGIDCNPENPGFRSRYGRSFLCPNPDKEPDEWAAFMLSLAGAMGEKPVLIAASDIFVSAIGRHAQMLSEQFIFSEAGCKLQAALATKEKQYALARERGLPSPRAAYIQSVEQLDQFCEGARFPALLKPRHHREWEALPEGNSLRGYKTVSAKTREELISYYTNVCALVPEAVAQEEIVGPDSAKYCYLSVYAQDGHRIGACVVHELRAYPLMYGCATLVEPVIDEEIDRVCNNFLLSLGYAGICEIELKRDVRDGQLLLIEVNPRFSGTGDCAKYTGVETGFLHYLDLIGQAPASVVPTRFGFRHVMLCAELAAFPKYLQEGLIGWKEWIQSLNYPMEYFDFDLSDFSNARVTAVKSAKVLLIGLLRKWNLRK